MKTETNFDNLLPPCGMYSEFIQAASFKFKLPIKTCRKKFGLFTISQWRKLIPMLLLILSSYNSNSQIKKDETKTNYPVVGFSSGYNVTHKSLNAGLQFGHRGGFRVRIRNVDIDLTEVFKNVYVSGDMIIPLSSNVFVPKIFAVNLGVNLSQFQPFISGNYSTIGSESEQLFKGTPEQFVNGFRFGYGIRYYPLSVPLCFNVQKQGKEFITSLSIYKAL